MGGRERACVRGRGWALCLRCTGGVVTVNAHAETGMPRCRGPHLRVDRGVDILVRVSPAALSALSHKLAAV